MKNFIQNGANITVIAAAATASGDFVVIGALTGVAQHDAEVDEPLVLAREGVYELPKLAAQAWAFGAKVYWDSDNDRLTTVAGGNLLVGCAVNVAANPSETGMALLDGVIR